VVSGILEQPCRQLMQDFFRSKRNPAPAVCHEGRSNDHDIGSDLSSGRLVTGKKE
jgi:hypothetical protein